MEAMEGGPRPFCGARWTSTVGGGKRWRGEQGAATVGGGKRWRGEQGAAAWLPPAVSAEEKHLGEIAASALVEGRYGKHLASLQEWMKKGVPPCACTPAAGRRRGSSPTEDGNNSKVPLSKQVEYFADTKANMTDQVEALLSKSLFLISDGGNDMFEFVLKGRPIIEFESFHRDLLSNYTKAQFFWPILP